MTKLLEKSRLILIILIPIAVGLYIRFDDLKIWHKYKFFYYYENIPLFTGYDAFYFARWAKEYKDGTYKSGKIDPLRFVPDNYLENNIKYPSPIPLLSFIAAELSKIQDTEIENVALWLTPFFAVLFVFPLALFFYKLDYPIAGYTGSLLGSISLIYLIRTSIVRYDTDALNLFFPLIIALFLILYFKNKDKTRLIHLIVGGIFCQLYNWWYQHPGLILVIFFIFVFYLLLENSFKVKNLHLIDILIFFIFTNPLILYHGIANFLGLFKTYLIKYHEVSWQGFPNIMMSISEARHFSFPQVVKICCGNIFLFFVGISGISILIIRKIREFLLILPIFVIGLMTFKGGNRFAMYLAPFIGIGFGTYLDIISRYLNKKSKVFYLFQLLAIIFTSIVILVSNTESFKYVATPKVTPSLVHNFIKLSEITPKNAWIWTWWDYGTAIQYFSHRAVFHDPQSQYSPKTYFVATSFSTSNPETAHNIILGIANLGLTGIKEKIKNGIKPQELKREIFAGKYVSNITNPIYWIFTDDMFPKFAWINYFGTWNFEQQRGKKTKLLFFPGCIYYGDNIFSCRNLKIDANRGLIFSGRKAMPVEYVCIKQNKNISLKKFDIKNNLVLEIIKNNRNRKANFIFVMDKDTFNSMFNQMYILTKYDPRFFELVYNNFPVMTVYKVKNTNKF